MPCVFSWVPLLVGDTVEVVSSSATSSKEFASTSLYNIYARVASKLYVAHTHTHQYQTELFTVLLVVQRSVLV